MSASTSHKENEDEAKDADLVHRSAAPDHKSAADPPNDHDNGVTGKPQTPSLTGEQTDPQGGVQKLTEDPTTTEDEHIMQGHPATQEQAQYETEVKEQDRWLPIANVARIMKTALPDNAKIAKEAKECMQECVSEFISFITSEASEKCQHEKRKTVNGEDIIFAMTSLGFENYSEALRIYLVRYRESNLGKADQQAQRTSSPGNAQGQTSSGDERDDAPQGSIGATLGQPVVSGSLPGVPLSSTFGGTQEADAPNAGGPYAYPSITNGNTHY